MIMSDVAPTAILYPNLHLGEGCQIEAFVLLGVPPRARSAGELATQFGVGALVRSHSVIYAGNIIGKYFQTGHGVLVREENQIGDNVSLGSHSIVEHHVLIEDGVRIHSQAFVPEFSILRQGCWIGPHAVLTNARYPLSPSAKPTLKGPTIESGAKIGANATVLPGVVIGAQALIGAGSVVTRDVPPGAIVVGNPARVVRSLVELGIYDNVDSAR
jgi:acetyltransferase-like isoleucine patch superfamily enzyme